MNPSTHTCPVCSIIRKSTSHFAASLNSFITLELIIREALVMLR